MILNKGSRLSQVNEEKDQMTLDKALQGKGRKSNDFELGIVLVQQQLKRGKEERETIQSFEYQKCWYSYVMFIEEE